MVLAVGWAVYLIPKALKHQDEMALSRSVDSFSDSVRVLGRRTSAVEPPAVAVEAPVEAPVEEVVPQTAPVFRVSRAAARRAARRRRRVLAVLVVGLLATVVTSYLAYTPWWSTAIPGGLVVAFLVVARLTVRKQQVRRAVVPAADVDEPSVPLTETQLQPDLGREDTMGLSRDQLAAAVAAPAMDEGGLWDPLPVTLPTYVNKARARRTVRTIELTQSGVTSSGHDESDTALAQEAAREAGRPAARPADSGTSGKDDGLEQRKVAGA